LELAPVGKEVPMLFRQLEYFVAVAQERHFARAAEKCYVSQPALSAAIAKLERELDVTLINRGHSFVGLTAEGERLVVWAKRILTEHDAFKAEVRAVGHWACIVPHTWPWTSLMAGDIRVFELVDPALTAQITVATNAAGPGSPVARGFSACAQKLNLKEFFDARLVGITGRR
jgi:DNA-binding transcriptional LysR family regulator